MRENLKDFLYHLNTRAIAHFIGSARNSDIATAFDKVIDLAEERGILYTYDYNSQMVAEMFKEVA